MTRLALVLLLSGSSWGFGQTVAANKDTVPVIESLGPAMQKFVDDGTISGAVTLIAHEGKVVHLQAVGLADIQEQKPMRPNAMFAIASMTKPIVATGVMILQDEGKLHVDDKISKYIPAFAQLKLSNGEPAERELTIRDALTHTSGLAGDQIFPASLEQAVDALAARPLAFQPGTRWQYSPGLNVAGRIIEIVAQEPLHDFLKRRIFDPLGMANTTFFPNDQQRKRIAKLYGPSDDDKSLVATPNFIADPDKVQAPNPSGGLFSTAREMFRFYQMVLNNGEFRQQRVLSEGAVRELTAPQTGDLKTGFTPGNCWGLGWCIVREPQGVTGMLSPGTFGHGGAFGTQGWVDPKTQTIYVLMIQRTRMGNSDASIIRQTFQELGSIAVAPATNRPQREPTLP